MADTYFRKLAKPPKSLITEGKTQLGSFTDGFEFINPLEATNLWKLPVPKWSKNLRLKEWQAFQFWLKDYFAFGALFDAKWVGVLILTVFNFKNREKHHTVKLVSPQKMKVARKMVKSESHCSWQGEELTIKNNLELNRFTVEGKSESEHFNIKAIAYHITEPLVSVIPFKGNKFMYSHKCLMPCEGFLEIQKKTIVFMRNEGLFMLDDHKGFYPFKYRYNWVTAAWFDREGNYYGFNLTQNQSTDAENFNENCFWVNGKIFVLPQVVFKFDSGFKTWHITDRYDMVNIDFKVITDNTLKMNLGLIKSDYQAPFGTFTGIIKNTNQTLRINGANGMGEIVRNKL